MRRVASRVLVAFFVCVSVFAQAPAPPLDAPLQRLKFLMGDWKAAADTQLGAGEGGFSFTPDVNGKVIVRRNFAVYKTGKAAGTRHDDLMVIYMEPPDTNVRAMYFDSEGHVIAYKVSSPAENTAVFESNGPAQAPRYRLSYSLAGEVLAGKFEVAPPGQEFKTYLEWKSQLSSAKTR